jgi:hypothetical protein
MGCAYSLRTAVEIDVPVERAAEVFSDPALWAGGGAQTSFVLALPDGRPLPRIGELEVGQTLNLTLFPPSVREKGSSPPQFTPVVLACTDRSLRWLGRVGFGGIFDGEHSFQLEPLGEAKCVLRHEEQFHGLLVPALRSMLDTDTAAMFAEFNAQFKAAAERAR